MEKPAVDGVAKSQTRLSNFTSLQFLIKRGRSGYLEMCAGTSLKVQWTLKTLEDSELPKQGAWVRLLIRELGSHMSHSQKKKKE